MKKLRKLFFFSIIMTLITSSFPLPNHIASAEEQNDEEVISDNEQDAFIVISEEQQQDNIEVNLFESDSTHSDILTTLENKTQITLIEQDDTFSFIEVRLENDELMTGYVLNEFIKLAIDEEPNLNNEQKSEKETNEHEKDATEENSETNDKQIDESEDLTVEGNEKTDEKKRDAKKERVLTTLQNETVLSGIALQEKTHVYSEQSKDSKPFKSYSQGTILKYFSFNEDWYRARVKIDGEWEIGYIHQNDVENITRELISLEGIALKSPTNVYEKTAKNAQILRNYETGTILKYQTFSDDWYVARVKYKGDWRTGFIHKSDVENIEKERVALEGIALKTNTAVYSKASKEAKPLRTYGEGSILKYQTFSSNWYIARVKHGGKWKTGYIHKNDVENKIEQQQSLSGIGLKQPTHIYKKATRQAGSHKSYAEGTVLKYKTFSKNWHQAIVYVGGSRKTGYIHKDDVEQTVKNQEEIDAWIINTPTNVYSLASRNAKIIKNDYREGKSHKVTTLSKNWYKTDVIYQGKKTTGYINVADISAVNATYTEYDLTLDKAVNIQLQGAPQTDKKQAWVAKSYIKNDRVTATELNVRLGPGTNYKSVDTIKKDTKVNILDEYNGWYVIEFDHNSQWTHASPKDVMNYLDPENYIDDERQKFQFLDLSRPSGASADVLNNYLNGKGILAGQGKAFIDAAEKQGINDIYLLSHAMLETGHGQSSLARGLEVGLDQFNKPQLVTRTNEHELTEIKTVYNMFGIRAFDSCPDACGAAYAYTEGWDTPYKSIVGGAEFISSDYIQGKNSEGTALNTLYKMRWNPEFAANNGRFGKQYATDVGWAVKQVNTMYNLYEEIGDYNLILDIPVYK